MFEKMKERAQMIAEYRAEKERAERERLLNLSEKELLVELIIETRKLNECISDKADYITTTIRTGSNW